MAGRWKTEKLLIPKNCFESPKWPNYFYSKSGVVGNFELFLKTISGNNFWPPLLSQRVKKPLENNILRHRRNHFPNPYKTYRLLIILKSLTQKDNKTLKTIRFISILWCTLTVLKILIFLGGTCVCRHGETQSRNPYRMYSVMLILKALHKKALKSLGYIK